MERMELLRGLGEIADACIGLAGGGGGMRAKALQCEEGDQ